MRRLITIPISHYCEKARWALDRAGLQYREDRHIQMFHWPHVRWAGGGKTVPVLVAEAKVYSESADILRYADSHIAEPRRLYPRANADAVAGLEHEFDSNFGVESRRLVYDVLRLPGARQLLPMNNAGAPRWEAGLMWLMFPIARAVLRRYLEVNPATVERAEERVRRTLDDVADRLGDGRPYLFGDQFTAADLTFAALCAPLSLPDNYGSSLPTRAQYTALDPRGDRFAGHPAVEFALRLYRSERGTPCSHHRR